MKRDLSPQSIKQKFQMLINMDDQQRQKYEKQKNLSFTNQIIKATSKQPLQTIINEANKLAQASSSQNSQQLIYTKGDIVKQISKLKPYLAQEKQQITTVQLQNYQNKKVSADQKKKLSDVVIYLNKRLCEKLQEQAVGEYENQVKSDRVKKEKQGWIYQVFYRSSDSIKAELANQDWKNGYVVLTTFVELYQNLTFSDGKLLKFNVSEIKRVKYTQQKQYQIMDIRFEGGTLQLGFLSDAKLELFDRMLFLMKNMARTSNNRLFQNQLIKSLYSQY